MDFLGSKVTAMFFIITAANGANEFRRCYNTSTDTHCFDVQYDTTTNRPLTASFENARNRCKDLNSHLIRIKDEETYEIVRRFLNNSNNPVAYNDLWTDAYRLNDYNKTYRWQWLDTTLPNMSASAVADTHDYSWYVAALEFQDENFHLTAHQPHFPDSYICEYPPSNCSSINSNDARMFNGRCYIATRGHVGWYGARNTCLKGGGDLASFANVSNINFTPWLGSDPEIRYWIGLRFARYIWKDSGEDVKFSKWIHELGYSPDPDYWWSSPCLAVCFKCYPHFSWIPNDCNAVDSTYVVCHTVRSLTETASATKTMTSTTATKSSATEKPPHDNSTPADVRLSSNISSTEISLGIGLGVGLGVPLVVFVMITILLAMRNRRLATLLDQKTRNARNDFGRIRELSVEQLNRSAQVTYVHQQLNRGIYSSEGMTNDKLPLSYDEFA